MNRTFDRSKVWQLNWSTYNQAMSILSALVSEKLHVGLVVGIARGGSRPAVEIASALGVGWIEISAQRNRSDEIYSAASDHLSVNLENLLSFSSVPNILLVDDICGSGGTIEAVLDVIYAHWKDIDITTLTLCRNQGSTFIPDIYIWEVRDWVVFPWESLPEYVITELLPYPNSADIKWKDPVAKRISASF
jgi:uncharacterized protein